MKLGTHSIVLNISRGSRGTRNLNSSPEMALLGSHKLHVCMYVCVPSYSSFTMGMGIRHRHLVMHHQKGDKSYFNILPETIST
jgi:hypothetical protein